jgi:hypothetical protein
MDSPQPGQTTLENGAIDVTFIGLSQEEQWAMVSALSGMGES